MKKVLILTLIFILPLTILTTYAATTNTVKSTIDRGQWGAEQHLGTFIVPSGSTAVNFSASVANYDQNGPTGYPEFLIDQRLPSGGTTTVFRQYWTGTNWNVTFQKFMSYGKVEEPVPLKSLKLGPGEYIFSIGGYPGSSGTLTFTMVP